RGGANLALPESPAPAIIAGSMGKPGRFHGGRGLRVSVSVRQLAELVQGIVQGDGDLLISGARTLKEARPGDITFVEDDKHAAQLHGCRASAAVVPKSVAANGLPAIQVADPLAAFVTIVRHL